MEQRQIANYLKNVKKSLKCFEVKAYAQTAKNQL